MSIAGLFPTPTAKVTPGLLVGIGLLFLVLRYVNVAALLTVSPDCWRAFFSSRTSMRTACWRFTSSYQGSVLEASSTCEYYGHNFLRR
jgi:hypothetical protein